METLLMEAQERTEGTKQCPFCAEDIRIEAIKCRYCGEFLNETARVRPKTKWYHSNTMVVIALLSLGPLALPLVWVHPRYKLVTKVGVSVGIVVLSIVLFYATTAMYKNLLDQVRMLGL